MDNKAKLVVSALGISMLIGSVQFADSIFSLVLFAWQMLVTFGVREVWGYLVTTGLMSCLSALAIPLLLVTGAVLTFGPWKEPKTGRS